MNKILLRTCVVLLWIPLIVVYVVSVIISVIVFLLAFPMMPLVYIVSGETYSGDDVAEMLDKAMNARFSPVVMVGNIMEMLRERLDEQ